MYVAEFFRPQKFYRSRSIRYLAIYADLESINSTKIQPLMKLDPYHLGTQIRAFRGLGPV